MILLVGLSAVTMSMMQASITAPTAAFRGCIRDAVAKAKTEKVSGDSIEDYLRGACTVQMGSLRSALVAFRMKNGMAKNAASADAQMTIDDYVATPADNYRFIAKRDAPAQPEKATAAVTPQQPKP